jgi:asparagine synthase (glutamine-hydrolysing)
MCGICGIIGLEPDKKPARIDIETMKRFLAHRGPDSNGTYINGSAALGHVRLSIIDLSENGNQPMSNEDGTVWIVFNGEIYNFQELKSALKKLGHSFKSRSDTEVVIHAYEEWGPECLNKFEGAFAFVIWDENQERFFAARDRFGEKPLFYSKVNGFFYFASELAPLVRVLPQRQEIDPVGLDLYLSYLFISAPKTIFTNVSQLPPAHYLATDGKGNIQSNRYWYLSFSSPITQSHSELQTQIRDHLRNAVSIRLTSDVPVGVLLSGGVDSAAIVASMREVMDGEILTFSMGTPDPNMNELERAHTISKLFGTKHNEFIVKPNAVEVIPKLVNHYGQPFADSSSIPTYYLSSLARQHVKVLLSGDGGDEMFAGYARYQIARILQMVKNLPSPCKGLISGISTFSTIFPGNKIIRRLNYIENLMSLEEPKAFAESFLQGFISKRSSLYKQFFNELLVSNNAINLFINQYSCVDGPTLLDRWINADLLTMLPGDYLTKVDIASMACSLEVRVPFLDRNLAEFSASIPASIKMSGGKQKALFKSAYKGILPDETLNHKKTGFSIPVHLWLRNELSTYVDRFLLDGKSEIIESFLNTKVVNEVVLSQRMGDNSQTTRVWALLNLAIWEELFINNHMLSNPLTLQDMI